MPTVLVTGCSSGFGLDAAVELGRRGWDVVATMRNLDKRERLDKAVADAGVAHRVRLTRLDVNDAESITAAVAAAGELDAVVNNAGVALGGAFEEVSDAQFREVMETNFFGVLAVTRATLPAMRQRGRGRIVVVSSVSAFHGGPGMSSYHASKWAVEGWAESLAMEVRPFGVEVVLVEPGSYATDIWDTSARVKPEGSPYAAMAKTLEHYVDEKIRGRARDPREVAVAIADAVTSSRPRFRYPVGPDAKVLRVVTRLLPHRMFDWVARREVGL
jgi:NAD(P)-dependent dehydrogenase (short-subunit alcohol dehydrogenase family)